MVEPTPDYHVTRRYYANKILTREESDKLPPIEVIPVRLLGANGTQQIQGNVSYSAGMTINIGNFESVRLEVGMTLPALPEEVEDAIGVCVDFVDEKLSEQKAMIDSLKKD
tara:strand:+ start:3680 stop:4012 length:333 start_codon:yes stop_codon:yes gene_type:complete